MATRTFCNSCNKEHSHLVNITIDTRKKGEKSPIQLANGRFCADCLPTVTFALRAAMHWQKVEAE
jgi:hypothetical protein